MDSNAMQRAMSANGYLGLALPPQQQQQQHLQHQHQQQQHNLPHHQQQQQQQQQQLMMNQNTYIQPPKLIQINDEEVEHQENGGGDEEGKKIQWQRMKWTNESIRYLILAVYYVEVDQENNEHSKKNSFQKKGKWKNVSGVMMNKGFVVSPQQCEDKFNDLNKRYKRVCDILGKGVACKVVENQRLLDSMDHIPPEQKEEVRKLLNSKHLFFPDMCVYHNSGVGGGCSSGGAGGSSKYYNNNNNNQQGPKFVNDESGENCDDDEDTEDRSRARRRGNNNGENDGCDGGGSSKRVKMDMGGSQSKQEMLENEVKCVLQDGTKTPWEKKQWMRKKLVELEEVRMMCQYQTFRLQRQRMKWVTYYGEKEKEMEKLRLENERMKLENDQMVLLLKQKELELNELQHQQLQQQQQEAHNRKSAESFQAHE